MNRMKLERFVFAILVFLLLLSNSTFAQVELVTQCNSNTIDLSSYSGVNTPAGSVLTLHRSPVPSNTNKISDLSSATSVYPGEYYIAFYNNNDNCYSTSSTKVLIHGCTITEETTNTADLSKFQINDSNNDLVLSFHTSLPASSSNRISKSSLKSVVAGVYYVSTFSTSNSCFSGEGLSVIKFYVLNPIVPECPATTVNLFDSHTVTNKPAGAKISVHTSLPASNANKISTAGLETLGEGTYFIAFYSDDGGSNCYPENGYLVTPISIVRKECLSKEICNDGIDNDGDGKIDCLDLDCPNARPIGKISVN